MNNDDDSRIPRLIIVAGTYDGVLAGWDTVEHNNNDDNNDEQNNIKNDIDLKLLKRRTDGKYLKLSFAMAAHEGSVRCIDVASGTSVHPQKKKVDKKKRPRSDSITSDTSSTLLQQQPEPGMLLSGGYDETINVFNLQKHNQIGELKTPSDLGSPLCCAFAPPSNNHHIMMSPPPPTAVTTTHALVGLTSGKIILYKKRDWSIQHILSGHDTGGVQCLAVHPTGKMALSGGRSDGKIILWDLMKGRLAYVIKLPKLQNNKVQCVNHIVWSADGTRYAYCYGSKITARDVAMNTTTADEEEGDNYLLDVQMPSRVNQLAFIGGPEGMFLCAACDDGGLPVLEVGQLLLDDDEDSDEEKIRSSNVKNERRAIMAIEPVDKVVAGDERFKCIQSVEGGSGFLVVTANSGGVVSLMDLEGAARMMLTPANENKGSDDDDDESKSDEDSEDDEEDDEVEAAVEILDSVRIGSGARITDLTAWSYGGSGEDGAVEFDNEDDADIRKESDESEKDEVSAAEEDVPTATTKRGSRKKENDNDFNNKIELDDEAVEKARKLVAQAKKHQKKKKKKRAKQS